MPKRDSQKKFKVPSQAACAEAIGIGWKKDKDNEKKLHVKYTELYRDQKIIQNIKPFLDPTPFEPISVPEDGDWLDEFPEDGQSFREFVQDVVKKAKKRKDEPKDTIYIMPLGDFSGKQNEIFCKTLSEYASLFFCMRVQMLGAVNIVDNKNLKRRQVPYSEEGDNKPLQYLTGDLLRVIYKNSPNSNCCVAGITMEDLYPEEDWNFVFGEATEKGNKGYGVFSFARYSPAFYGEPATESSSKLLLERSLKVMVHEIGHMFGLEHCIYYKCIMNGSNSIEEEDVAPFHLCPVCLRKLQYSIGFDVSKRYKGLLKFYQAEGFEDAANWIKRLLL